VTTDIIQQGDRAFVGAFAIDSTPGPGGSGVCNLAGTTWLNLATSGEIRNGTIDSIWDGGSGKIGAYMKFVVAQGNRQDLEALVGCTLLESWTTWQMTWGEAGTLFTYYPQSQSVFYATSTRRNCT
jgi:hypothetical protein